MKTTVGEWKAFYAADWKPFGGGTEPCAEDYTMLLDGEPFDDTNGLDGLRDEQTLSFSGGYVYDQNDADAPLRSLGRMFQKWRRAQTHTYVLVRVPKDRLSEFHEVIGRCAAEAVTDPDGFLSD